MTYIKHLERSQQQQQQQQQQQVQFEEESAAVGGATSAGVAVERGGAAEAEKKESDNGVEAAEAAAEAGTAAEVEAVMAPKSKTPMTKQWQDLVFGAMGGAIAAVLTHPVDVIKTRIMTSRQAHLGGDDGSKPVVGVLEGILGLVQYEV